MNFPAPIRSRHIFQFAAAALVVCLGSNAASAGHESPLYRAAECYREAVRDFEREVLRSDYVQRCDRRLVDDLEDSTSRLKSVSRDLHRPERIFEAVAKTDALHCQVERVFFTQSVYHPNPRWDHYWHVVAHTYRNLQRELQCLGQSGRGHGRGYGHAHSRSSQTYRDFARDFRPPTTRSNNYFGSQFRVEVPAPVPTHPGFDPRFVQPRYSYPSPPRYTGRDDEPRRTPVPTGRPITSRDDLRSILIGAALQRLVQ